MPQERIATSDGITREDWDAVHALALEIASAAMAEDAEAEAHERARMLALLSRLASRYGDKPSIIATLADYVDTPEEQVALLEKAYALAEELSDHPNMTFVAHSLAVVTIEDLADLDAGRASLTRLRSCLTQHSEEHEATDCHRLTLLLDELADRTRGT